MYCIKSASTSTGTWSTFFINTGTQIFKHSMKITLNGGTDTWSAFFKILVLITEVLKYWHLILIYNNNTYVLLTRIVLQVVLIVKYNFLEILVPNT